MTYTHAQKNNGFTIIETLVAITILMISIAGPLTIAQKGLSAAINSRDQVIASYLGQDLMEYIKNIRDINIVNNRSMFATLSCIGGQVCGMETGPAGNPSLPSTLDCSTISTCIMYLDAMNGYTYVSPGNIKTQFNRSFTATAIDAALTKYLVVVTVSWYNGTIPNQVVLKSVLSNTLR
jgi:Tfp pilus assembly protein PilV